MKRTLTISFLFVLLGRAAHGSTSPSELVSKIEAAAKGLKGFHCTMVNSREYGARTNRPAMKIEETLDVTFQRPNLFTITSKDSNEPNAYKSISDGKSVFGVSTKNYSKAPIDAKAADFHWYHNDLLRLLVDGTFERALELPIKPKTTLLLDEEWNGKTYHVLDMALGGGFPIDYKIYVGPDYLVRRIIHSEENDGRKFSEDITIQTFDPAPPKDASLFQFHPTSQQTPYDTSAMRRGETPLITVGKAAAPFSLPTPAGPRLSLSDALQGKKALLLNFWFVGCPPCRAEHPKLDKLYREFKDQGLEVLSVDDQDSAHSVAKYWAGAKLSFRTVLSGPMAAVDPKTGYPDYRGPKLPDYAELVPYGIHECPTNVLLNSEGVVVYVSNSWDEAGLRHALEQLDIHP
jgi:thiol-disulfide isomerase/thioredoxin/outer membrane lipoprotein-sorting protein